MSSFNLSACNASRRPTDRRGGFTLLELTGVLAIVTILAAVTLPPAITMIDRETRKAEKETLSTLEGGLLQSLRRDFYIPGPGDWASTIARHIDYSPAQVAVNPRGKTRRFLVDPDFMSNGDSLLPYSQSIDGLPSHPQSPRLIILSSIGRPLPSGSLDFDELWAAPENTVPGSWSWDGRGESLVVHRIHLSALFHRILLFDVNDEGALHSVADSATREIKDTGAGIYYRDAVYLDQTPVHLVHPDGILYRTELVRFGQTHVYDGGWNSFSGGNTKITVNGASSK